MTGIAVLALPVISSNVKAEAKSTLKSTSSSTSIIQSLEKEHPVMKDSKDLKSNIKSLNVKIENHDKTLKEKETLEKSIQKNNEVKEKQEKEIKTLTGKESEVSNSISSLQAEISKKKAEKAKAAEEERKKKEAEERSRNGIPEFGPDGLLVERYSAAAEEVIRLLLAIPDHKNGKDFHYANGIDAKIDALTTAEAVAVLSRIEDGGFGQTGDGYAGQRTPESHQNFVKNQLVKRYSGSIKNLLKEWGTYTYDGY